MGEVLPFMIDRATGALGRSIALDPVKTTMKLTPSEYFARNFHITTSGFFSDPPLHCALEVLGPDRIMFAVDHPFSNNAEAGAGSIGPRSQTATAKRSPISTRSACSACERRHG